MSLPVRPHGRGRSPSTPRSSSQVWRSSPSSRRSSIPLWPGAHHRPDARCHPRRRMPSAHGEAPRAHDHLHAGRASRGSPSSRASPVPPTCCRQAQFGFIIGFILAAFVAGWFAERAWDRKPAPRLRRLRRRERHAVPVRRPLHGLYPQRRDGPGLSRSWQSSRPGCCPFILGGLIKAALAALIIPSAWALVRAVDATKSVSSRPRTEQKVPAVRSGSFCVSG